MTHSRRGDVVGGFAAGKRSKFSDTNEHWCPQNGVLIDEQLLIDQHAEVPDDSGWLQYGVVNLQRLVGIIEVGQLLMRAKLDHFRLGRVELQTV